MPLCAERPFRFRFRVLGVTSRPRCSLLTHSLSLVQGEQLSGMPASEAVMIAAGPQFGTISLGGVLIAIVEILRAIANFIQQASADSDNIVMVRSALFAASISPLICPSATPLDSHAA